MSEKTEDPLLLDYELPRELIAQEPLANRADARLLVVDRESQSLEHRYFRDLPSLLRPTDRLVLNDTRVVPAQLLGKRTQTGGAWQGLFLGVEPSGDWRLICKTRGSLKPNETVDLIDRDGRKIDRLWLLEKLGDGQWLARPEGDAPHEEVLARSGRVPLPHYIRDGQMVDDDLENYQTVYARKPGAVAAPTAGLHFTEQLLRQIGAIGVEFTPVTLHVGMGTFRPISTNSVEDHVMHSEWCELSAEGAKGINQTRTQGGRVIAVGTTSVRTLETAAANVDQDGVAAWSGQTDLFIRPPYEFKAVDALVTNFHFPRTTLLLMVQALAGTELVKRAYEEAVRERYRFYSYGDAMLIV